MHKLAPDRSLGYERSGLCLALARIQLQEPVSGQEATRHAKVNRRSS